MSRAGHDPSDHRETRLIASQQQLLRPDSESQNPLSPTLVAQALQSVAPLLRDIDGVVCSDYQKGVCIPALIEPLFAMARTAKARSLLTPKRTTFPLPWRHGLKAQSGGSPTRQRDHGA